MHCGVLEDAVGLCKWNAPDDIVIQTPLVAVMHCGSFVAFMENGNLAIIGKGSNAE